MRLLIDNYKSIMDRGKRNNPGDFLKKMLGREV